MFLFSIFTGILPNITRLSPFTLIRGKGGLLSCYARGQPGIQSLWSSDSNSLNNFTSVGNPVSKQISDFVYDFESTLNILPNISRFFFKENNSTTCQVVSKKRFIASCSMNFKCSVFYEEGYEVYNTTTLTVTNLNGKKYYS